MTGCTRIIYYFALATACTACGGLCKIPKRCAPNLCDLTTSSTSRTCLGTCAFFCTASLAGLTNLVPGDSNSCFFAMGSIHEFYFHIVLPVSYTHLRAHE